MRTPEPGGGIWALRLENMMGGFMLRRRVLIGIDRRLTIGFGRGGFMLRQMIF
jgi:hypothetical protein